MRPGTPVYRERSMTSASFGIDALPLATLRTRSSSTMTTALVMTFPVPSTNFPNLIAFVAATAVEDVARKNRTTSSLLLRMRPPGVFHREGRRPSEVARVGRIIAIPVFHARSEEHTSELQSRSDLVCRLLL